MAENASAIPKHCMMIDPEGRTGTLLRGIDMRYETQVPKTIKRLAVVIPNDNVFMLYSSTWTCGYTAFPTLKELDSLFGEVSTLGPFKYIDTGKADHDEAQCQIRTAADHDRDHGRREQEEEKPWNERCSA